MMKSKTFLADVWERLRRDTAFVLAALTLSLLVMLAVFAPSFNRYSYREQMLQEDYVNMPPRIQALKWLPLFNGHATLKAGRLRDPYV